MKVSPRLGGTTSFSIQGQDLVPIGGGSMGSTSFAVMESDIRGYSKLHVTLSRNAPTDRISLAVELYPKSGSGTALMATTGSAYSRATFTWSFNPNNFNYIEFHGMPGTCKIHSMFLTN